MYVRPTVFAGLLRIDARIGNEDRCQCVPLGRVDFICLKGNFTTTSSGSARNGLKTEHSASTAANHCEFNRFCGTGGIGMRRSGFIEGRTFFCKEILKCFPIFRCHLMELKTRNKIHLSLNVKNG